MDTIKNIFLDPAMIFILANSLYLISYLLISMLYLRVTACAASLLTIPYFFFQAEPLWLALFWQCAFLTVNVVNLGILLYDRRKRTLTPIQNHAYKKYFSDLKEYEAFSLLNIAKEKVAQKDKKLITANQPLNELIFILEGSCDIFIDSKTVSQLGGGQFIGEMAFISDEKTSADVIVEQPVLYLSWDHADLKRLFKESSLYHYYFASMMNKDLSIKLTNMNRFAQAPEQNKVGREDEPVANSFAGMCIDTIPTSR